MALLHFPRPAHPGECGRPGGGGRSGLPAPEPCECLGGLLCRVSLGEGREAPTLIFGQVSAFEPLGQGPAQNFMVQNLRRRAGFRL